MSALVVLGSVAACATATNNGAPGAGATAGTSDGTSGAAADTGGSPAGGSAQGQAGASAGSPGAGAPSSAAGAATGGSSTGGSATGGSSTGGSATAGAATGGSAGHAGALGTAGAATGGSSGTSSGGGPPTDGDGGIVAGACANPIDASMGKSGNFGTTSAVCYRTTETFNSIGCSNFTGRTIKVNGVLATCNGMKATFAPAIGGYNYFDVSAGDLSYAGFVWYSS